MQIILSMLEKWAAGVQLYMRTCDFDDSLTFYGVGCSGHWSVQSSMNVLSALACIGVEKQDQKMINQALSMLRYALKTHAGVGNISCVNDGKQWGCHWISCLGPERMAHGVNALRPYMTPEDKALLKEFHRIESDWLLEEYEVVAAPYAKSRCNKPESNIWNGGFLFRTALDYPDLPNANQYIEKATKFLLNGLSIAEDAESDKMYLGKALKEWHVGANFLPGWSLDHHGYMNVAYSFVALSNIAMLHYNFRERGQKAPECLYHHVNDLWNVLKHFVFSDGRMLRIGGDTRTRYTYGQDFLLPVLTFAADHLHDADAAVMESRLIRLIKKEQDLNPDGMFFTNRLAHLKEDSYYWYTRLESDPPMVLGQLLHWHTLFHIPFASQETPIEINPEYTWHNDYHGACLLRTNNTIRSCCHSSKLGSVNLCSDAAVSDLTEWQHQLNGEAGIGLQGFQIENGEHTIHSEQNTFRSCSLSYVCDWSPKGEGETVSHVVRHYNAVCALPDGHSMIVLDRMSMEREFSVNHVYPLHWLIPNDCYNGFTRKYQGENYDSVLKGYPGTAEIIDTCSRSLTVDDRNTLGLIYGGDSLTIYRPAEQAVHAAKEVQMLTSLYADIVTIAPVLRRFRPRKGVILADTGCWITAGVTRPESLALSGTKLELPEVLKGVRVTDLNGKEWKFIANFSEDAVLFNGKTIPALDSILLAAEE